MYAGSGGRVDSQVPLIHTGALRRQNLRRSSNSSLSVSPARKALLGECRGGGGGASRRWGSILDFCVNLAHILQRGWDPNKCREHALRCTELSHRMPGYTTRRSGPFFPTSWPWGHGSPIDLGVMSKGRIHCRAGLWCSHNFDNRGGFDDHWERGVEGRDPSPNLPPTLQPHLTKAPTPLSRQGRPNSRPPKKRQSARASICLPARTSTA